MGYGSYLIKRTFLNILVLFAVITLNFIIFRLIPANPVALFAAGRNLRPEQIAALFREFGLDKPLYVQFILYFKGMLTFNFGFSYHNGAIISTEIMQRLPGTLILLVPSTVISIIIGILIGVVGASRRGSIFDTGIQALSLFTYALPAFWLGILFLLTFYVGLHWFPSGGLQSAGVTGSNPLPYFMDQLWHLTLPMLVLIIISVGGWSLLARNSILEVLSDDYIITARAKGLPERTVLYKHAFRNAILPIVTQIALTFGFILSGAVLTETVFSWPGLGRYIFLAVNFLDYPVLQAMFFLIGLSIVIANFLSDIAYGLLDPRVRY